MPMLTPTPTPALYTHIYAYTYARAFICCDYYYDDLGLQVGGLWRRLAAHANEASAVTRALPLGAVTRAILTFQAVGSAEALDTAALMYRRKRLLLVDAVVLLADACDIAVEGWPFRCPWSFHCT